MHKRAFVLACLVYAAHGARLRTNRFAEGYHSGKALETSQSFRWSASSRESAAGTTPALKRLVMLLASNGRAAFNPASQGNAGRLSHSRSSHRDSAVTMSSGPLPELDTSITALMSPSQANLTRRHLCVGGALSAAILASTRSWPASADAVATATATAAAAVPAPPQIQWVEVPGIPTALSNSRKYAVATLANGIRALIVSDPGSSANLGELAVTLDCGSLADPPEFEGLAHLAEHVTLATDPAGLQTFFDKDLDGSGDSNGATGERSTSYTCRWLQNSVDEEDLQKKNANKAALQSQVDALNERDISKLADRFAAFMIRAQSSDPTEAAPMSVVRNEVGRVDGELDEIRMQKNRQVGLLEAAELKARTPQSSLWRRLHRGDRFTLPVETDSEVRALSTAVTRFRAERYTPEIMTLAAVSALPLEVFGRIIENAFSKIPQNPAAKPRDSAADTRPLFVVSPFSDTSTTAPPAAALKWQKNYTMISLAWDVQFNNLQSEALQKPLSLISHALVSPHATSLSSLLRERGLAPLSIESDPVVKCTTAARADEWVLWKMDITLLPEAKSRWREALALAVAAVKRLAENGVPTAMVADVQIMTNTRWKWESRPPSAFELSTSMQRQLPDELIVQGTRLFIGDPALLAKTATGTAAQIAAKYPTVTVWAPNFDTLGIKPNATGPPLQNPFDRIAKLVPLEMPAPSAKLANMSLSPAEVWTQAYLKPKLSPGDLMPPPDNPWVPTSLGPANKMDTTAYRIKVGGFEGKGGKDSGLVTVQLGGCVTDKEIEAIDGDKMALFQVGECPNVPAESVIGTAILQLEAPAVSGATVEQIARLELWLVTLNDAISELTAAAGFAGIQCEVGFNSFGLRLFVYGYAQRIPSFTVELLKRTLAHVPPAVGPVVEAAQRVGPIRARGSRRIRTYLGEAGLAKLLDEMQRVTPDDMAAEVQRLFISTSGARLLLAGAIDRDQAGTLASAVRRELEPLLPLGKAPAASSTSLPKELKKFSNILYYPEFLASNLAGLCTDPTTLETLSQCNFSIMDF